MSSIKYLIFGNYNPVMLSLIARLKKEKEQIFTITDDKNAVKNRPKGIFQEYNFSYENKSIAHVIESVLPDIILIAVACDDISFHSTKQMDVAYIAGLTNILVSFRRFPIQKLIYLSVESGILPEKDAAVRLGEEICRNFEVADKQRVTVVRINGLYGCYRKNIIYDSKCTQLCEKVLHGAEEFSTEVVPVLYLEDAVEAVMRIMKKDLAEYEYYLSGSEFYTEQSLAQLLLQKAGKEESAVEPAHRNPNKDMADLGVKEKYKASEGLQLLYTAAVQDSKLTGGGPSSEKKKWIPFIGNSKYRPFLENIIIFGFLQLLVGATAGASFHEIIDVYLIYTIIFGVTYGMLQAVIAAGLSVVGRFYYLFTLQGFNFLFKEYDKYLWTLQLLTLAVIVGYLKDKYKKSMEDYKQEEGYLRSELENLTEINKSNMRVKEIYENRLLGYKDSFVNVYDIVSKLDDMETHKVIFNTITIVTELINTKDVAIYMCDKYGKYGRLIAASSEFAKSKGKSIELARYRELHQHLLAREIYMNRTVDFEYPVLAGGTFNDDTLAMVIIVWTVPYEYNNLNQANIFTMICKLVDKTMGRVYRYMDSMESSNHVEGTPVMTKEAFHEVLELYQYGYQLGYLQYSMLKVTGYKMSQQELYQKLNTLVRNTDYIGLYEDSICALLTNSGGEEIKYVYNRFIKQEIEVEIIDVSKVI